MWVPVTPIQNIEIAPVDIPIYGVYLTHVDIFVPDGIGTINELSNVPNDGPLNTVFV